MNLFKKYVTPVLLVAIVASYSPIEAIDFNRWFDCARSKASQVYDVLTRKKVWVPIAAMGTLLCLLKMSSSGKKIWQKKIADVDQKHKESCEEVLKLDLEDDNFADQLGLAMFRLKPTTTLLPSLTESLLLGLVNGVQFSPVIDPDTEELVVLPAPGWTRLITNPIRGCVNCTANVSQRLALRWTDINGQIDEQQKRIKSNDDVLLNFYNLKNVRRMLNEDLVEQKEDGLRPSSEQLNRLKEVNLCCDKFKHLQIKNGVLCYPDESDNIKRAKG